MHQHTSLPVKPASDRNTEFEAALAAYAQSYRVEQRKRRNAGATKATKGAQTRGWLLAFARS